MTTGVTLERAAVALLAAADDRAATTVAAHLPPERVLWLDNEWLVRHDGLSWALGGDGDAVLVAGDRILRPADIGSVFYRPEVRYGPGRRWLAEYVLVPDPALGDGYHEFGRREARAALLGALGCETTRWVNSPAAEAAADLKLRQLALAADLGLTVPSTIVSDDLDRLAAFWHEHGGNVVTKAVGSASAWAITEVIVTRRVSAADLDTLAELSPCVTVFQEEIPAAYDLRVTLVGDETFACEIDSQQGDSPLDWRLDQSVLMRPCGIPDGVVSALQRLRRQLGLEFGAADLRIKPDGTPVFLEINARGEFTFVEDRTGMPISKAVAALLLSYADTASREPREVPRQTPRPADR